jgi:uncharacterized protein (TIRG00374 family)
LGLAFLVVAVRQADLGQAWEGITAANPAWVALSLLIVLLTTAAKIARWRGLFPGRQRPDPLHLGRALLIGQLVNALFPARIGDVSRAYQIGIDAGISKAMALGTVAAEKAFDIVCLLACSGIAVALVPLPLWLDLSLSVVAAGGLLLILCALAWPEERIVAGVSRWVSRLHWRVAKKIPEVLARALTGLAALREPRMALVACAWSVVIWVLAAGTNYALFQAFDLHLSPGAALFVLISLHVGISPPSAPGRLGVFHYIALLSLQAFGVDRSIALAYATVLHLIVYLPQLVPGSVLLASVLPRKRNTAAGEGAD